jgi:putative CocE/NonD family hydrolase
MRSCGHLKTLQSGLLSLVIYLAAGCFQMDAPVEPGASEEPLAVSRDRAKVRIDDDGVVVQVDVPTPMRDGVRLFADVYLPDTAGPFPVILTRMPYDKQSAYGMMPALGRFWAQQGYAYVAQDVRGRFKSEGRFGRVDEVSDGYDTIEWIVKQAWCDGNIGVTGESYYGYTTWAAAVGQHPNLKSIAPVDITPDLYERRFVNGAFRLRAQGGWALNMGAREEQNVENIDWWHLPLISMGKAAGLADSIFTEWIQRAARSDFWDERSFHHRYHRIAIPALHIGGWYDNYANGTIAGWQGVRKQSSNLEARQNQWLVMGPWDHEDVSTQFFDPPEPLTKIGRVDIGTGAATTYSETLLAFFDYTLKGIDNRFEKTPSVRIFVIGDNRWRYEREWPPARTEYTQYYFHSDGQTRSGARGGSLDLNPPDDRPGREHNDSYDYDPANPVVYGMDHDPWERALAIRDRSSIAKRPDVLTYNAPPLTEALEITGPVTVTLYAASTAPDTDFTAALVDVYPDGYAQLIQEGILRASFRESDTEPTPIEPGRIYQYDIDLWATSYVVQPGHQIRVEISSSNFPRFARNLNTGNPFGISDEIAVATQTIYHSTDYPSHISLPVIPR